MERNLFLIRSIVKNNYLLGRITNSGGDPKKDKDKNTKSAPFFKLEPNTAHHSVRYD